MARTAVSGERRERERETIRHAGEITRTQDERESMVDLVQLGEGYDAYAVEPSPVLPPLQTYFGTYATNPVISASA